MRTQTFIEILDAAHLTRHITSPWEQRGGIMIVGPPGVMKTSLCKTAYKFYPDVLYLSDLNVNSLMNLRESLITGTYSSIVFPEYEKLYQRRADSASNVEGTIKQLIEEGFSRASFEAQDAITFTARTLVVGAMTWSFYTRRIDGWRESGFKRRFLWCGVKLANPAVIMESIHKWEWLHIDGIPRKYPDAPLKVEITPKESNRLRDMLGSQAHEASAYVLLKKIFAVLKWKYKTQPRKPMQIMEEFEECLDNKLANLEV